MPLLLRYLAPATCDSEIITDIRMHCGQFPIEEIVHTQGWIQTLAGGWVRHRTLAEGGPKLNIDVRRRKAPKVLAIGGWSKEVFPQQIRIFRPS